MHCSLFSLAWPLLAVNPLESFDTAQFHYDQHGLRSS